MAAFMNMQTVYLVFLGLVAIGFTTGYIQFKYVYYRDGKVYMTNRKDINVGDSMESVEAKNN
jgi:hypothetical protein